MYFLLPMHAPTQATCALTLPYRVNYIVTDLSTNILSDDYELPKPPYIQSHEVHKHNTHTPTYTKTYTHMSIHTQRTHIHTGTQAHTQTQNQIYPRGLLILQMFNVLTRLCPL